MISTLRRIIVAGYYRAAPYWLTAALNNYIALKPLAERACPLCGYSGTFRRFGRPPRLDAECKRCHSLERHRLLWLYMSKAKLLNDSNRSILHFAPEPVLERHFRRIFGANYRTADLFQRSDLKIDIEKIDLPSGSVDLIICNHVLEHVKDTTAINELSRILSPTGRALLTVPIVEGWSETYENPKHLLPEERELHYGQSDHLRYYGADFRRRLSDNGLKLIAEYDANPDDVAAHALIRGDKIFVASRSNTGSS
jgi:SAM-dependent methyltransferase